MTDTTKSGDMPADVAAIADCGFATWASDDVDSSFRRRFAEDRIPVDGVRHVRQWGIQVDDERALMGHEQGIEAKDLRGLRSKQRASILCRRDRFSRCALHGIDKGEHRNGTIGMEACLPYCRLYSQL